MGAMLSGSGPQTPQHNAQDPNTGIGGPGEEHLQDHHQNAGIGGGYAGDLQDQDQSQVPAEDVEDKVGFDDFFGDDDDGGDGRDFNGGD